MRLDRGSFLWAAIGMYACHSEHKRQALPEPARPEPPRVEEPTAIDPGESVVDDAGALEVALDAAADAPPTPPALVPSFAELSKKCRALPADSPDCGDSRKRMCQTVLAEFDRPAAASAIECYASMEGCDSCGVRTCTQSALARAPRRAIPSCAGVEKKATETSDESYGQLMLELCEQYASGMTKQGQTRFIRCLTKNMGIGVRFCLWDPSATPCSEGSGGF